MVSVTEVEAQVVPSSCVRSPDVGDLGVGNERERASFKYYFINIFCYCLLSLTKKVIIQES